MFRFSERLAVAGYFAMLGFVCASWMSSVDDLKVLLGLTDSELGWLLIAGPCGNLVSFTFASALFARLGSRRGLTLVASFYLVAGLGMALCFRFQALLWVWSGMLATFGACGNLVNIAVNTQAGIVERRLGRSVMNSFHGMFSVACLVGGLLALGASWVSVSAAWRIGFTVVCAVLAHLVLFRFLPCDAAASQVRASRHRPDRALLALGFCALVIMGCEGAMSDWVGVFYRDSLAAPASRVKWGFCAVMGAMTSGRFLTDRLIARFGSARIFRVYGSLVSIGLAIALAMPYFPLKGLALHLSATLGFAVAGFGVSALVPILYSKANGTTAMPAASAVTFLGSMGFLGFFIGPPLIGYLSERTSLSCALGLFVFLVLAIAWKPHSR